MYSIFKLVPRLYFYENNPKGIACERLKSQNVTRLLDFGLVSDYQKFIFSTIMTRKCVFLASKAIKLCMVTYSTEYTPEKNSQGSHLPKYS